MGYLTNMRMKHGKEYSEWTDIVDKVRSGLNKIRKHPKDEDPFSYPFAEVNMSEEPKYKIGDMVYHKLERPIDALNKQYARETFRTGDVRYDILQYGSHSEQLPKFEKNTLKKVKFHHTNNGYHI